MINFVDIAVVAGMMFLRIGVPLLIVLALGYGLKRLDKRWEAEARRDAAKRAEQQAEQRPEVPAPQPTPAPVRRPGKQPVTPQPLPFIPPPAVGKEERPAVYAQAGVSASKPGMKASGKHCWDERGCSESQMKACPAPAHADQPCWQARFNAEGHIPEECVSCDIFQRYPSM